MAERPAYTVQIIDAPMVPGGKAVVMAGPDGEILPGQCKAVLDCETGAIPLVTITFEVDGKHVRLGQ